MEVLDWVIMLGGVAGFVGTLLDVKTFYDMRALDGPVQRYGERRVRLTVAGVYLLFAVSGLLFILAA